MRKWLAIPLFLLLALVMIFSSCGGATTTTSTPTATSSTTTTTSAPTSTAVQPTSTAPAATGPTGTITVAVADFGYESLDPIYYESTWGWSMYDSLLRWDANGNFIGGVADSYSIAPDGVTWTFKIHQGIKFWNGDPLTAADVKFSVRPVRR